MSLDEELGGANYSYIVRRELERKYIKQVLSAKKYDIKFSKHDNYIVLNGEVFNGWSKADIEGVILCLGL